MTHNQISYQGHLENVRHNQEAERLTDQGQRFQRETGLASAAAQRYSADKHLEATQYSADKAYDQAIRQAEIVADWQGDKTTQNYFESLSRLGQWAIPFAFGHGLGRSGSSSKRDNNSRNNGSGPSAPATASASAPRQQPKTTVEFPDWYAVQQQASYYDTGAWLADSTGYLQIDDVLDGAAQLAPYALGAAALGALAYFTGGSSAALIPLFA